MFLQQGCCQVGALHLEAGFALRELSGTRIVQDGCGEQSGTGSVTMVREGGRVDSG
ncbi:hypothetical protein [Streptomyces sp. NPDC001502]|uniref:hypothetical protein n=1 Tax=Streptomyces sp. NPDC001502 TaxID=3364578 RepID=UPI0036CF1436